MLSLTAIAGCGQSGGATGAGGSGGTGGGTRSDAGPGSGGTTGSAVTGGPDASPAAAGPTTCAGIRNCRILCASDAACAQHCVDSAPADARQAYQAVYACSVKDCPQQDDACRCDHECLDDPGDCDNLVEACRGLDDDNFCDIHCH